MAELIRYVHFDNEPSLVRPQGNVGDLTPIKDKLGNLLNVGDSVEVYNKDGEFCELAFVCGIDGKTFEQYYPKGSDRVLSPMRNYIDKTKPYYFVHGIVDCCSQDGQLREGWYVIKYKGYEWNMKRPYSVISDIFMVI